MNAEADTDLELARRAAAGDERAFTLLMRTHKEPLYRFVRRYTGEADAAYEIVQESFISAWKAINRFDGRRTFLTWLRAIALNKCRDRGRRLAVRRLILGDAGVDVEAQAQPDPSPTGEEALVHREDLATLDRAIAQLPAKLKEPLLLTYFDEMSQQEAAVFLGITVKAVETRVYRARQLLADVATLRRQR